MTAYSSFAPTGLVGFQLPCTSRPLLAAAASDLVVDNFVLHGPIPGLPRVATAISEDATPHSLATSSQRILNTHRSHKRGFEDHRFACLLWLRMHFDQKLRPLGAATRGFLSPRLTNGVSRSRFGHSSDSRVSWHNGGAILSCPRGAAKRTRIGNLNRTFQNGCAISGPNSCRNVQ